MKNEKSSEEKIFEKLVASTKEREKELFARHKEGLEARRKQEAELEKIQEDLNKGPRQTLKNMQVEYAQLEGQIENLKMRKQADLELADERIEKTGQGYDNRLKLRKEYDDKIEALEVKLEPDLKRLRTMMLKTEHKIRIKEWEYLNKKQIYLVGINMFWQNLDFFYKSKMKELGRLYQNVGNVMAVNLGLEAKVKEIQDLEDKIVELGGEFEPWQPVTRKRPTGKDLPIGQARGKVITSHDLPGGGLK